MDKLSKSDPVCVLYELNAGNWTEIGRTEKIKNNLNPNWMKKFDVTERGGEGLKLRFKVYDWDDKRTANLKKQDFLAQLDCSLDAIIASPGSQFITVLRDGPSKGGQFIITATKTTSDTKVVTLCLGARHLDNKDKFGKSDPFFVVNKMVSNGQLTPVYKSEWIKNTLNPTWKPMTISTKKLCNGDYNCRLRIDVFDYDKEHSQDLIGHFSTTLTELTNAKGRFFPVINPKKQTTKRNYRNSGEVMVTDVILRDDPMFRDA